MLSNADETRIADSAEPTRIRKQDDLPNREPAGAIEDEQFAVRTNGEKVIAILDEMTTDPTPPRIESRRPLIGLPVSGPS